MPVHGIIGVARSGQHHARAARLHGHRADADRGIQRIAHRCGSVCKRREDRTRRIRRPGILRQPDAASCRPHVDPVPGRIRRINDNRRHAPRHWTKALRYNRHRSKRLPCRKARCRCPGRPRRRRTNTRHRARPRLRIPTAPGQKALTRCNTGWCGCLSATRSRRTHKRQRQKLHGTAPQAAMPLPTASAKSEKRSSFLGKVREQQRENQA